MFSLSAFSTLITPENSKMSWFCWRQANMSLINNLLQIMQFIWCRCSEWTTVYSIQMHLQCFSTSIWICYVKVMQLWNHLFMIIYVFIFGGGWQNPYYINRYSSVYCKWLAHSFCKEATWEIGTLAEGRTGMLTSTLSLLFFIYIYKNQIVGKVMKYSETVT